jgi:hypothetical protein
VASASPARPRPVTRLPAHRDIGAVAPWRPDRSSERRPLGDWRRGLPARTPRRLRASPLRQRPDTSPRPRTARRRNGVDRCGPGAVQPNVNQGEASGASPPGTRDGRHSVTSASYCRARTACPVTVTSRQVGSSPRNRRCDGVTSRGRFAGASRRGSRRGYPIGGPILPAERRRDSRAGPRARLKQG